MSSFKADELDIAKLFEIVKNEKLIGPLVNVLAGEDEDMKLPWTQVDKKGKGELGYRQETETHRAIRMGLWFMQDSAVGPSYNFFGMLKFFLECIMFLVICDLLVP